MSEKPARLVIAPNWIGDAVMSLPLLRALQRDAPGSRVAVLARPGPAAIYRAEGSAGEVLVAAGIPAAWRAAARGRFGEAWLLPNSFRAAFLAFLAGIPERIGYTTDGRAPFLTRGLPPPPRTSHQLRDYDALLESRGVTPDLAPPRLPVPAESADIAAFALARAGLPPNRPLVLLAPGAAFGWTKRWPAERFGELGRVLLERGFLCAVVIGPDEEPLAERARVAAGGYLPALGADLDPMGVAALAARALVVVSNDSGPMHLAAAVGTPVVAMFGPTDPGRTGPSGVPSEVLDRYVFCSPCYRKECPYRHECMREIEVENVLAAVLRLAAGRSEG